MKRKIGLSLSGGGSKGLIHVGALQYFEEHKIKFNILSSTSAGSIVSGLYSCGKKPFEILRFFESTKMFSPKHIGFSTKGLVNTASLRNEFEKEIGNPNIEDLNNDIQIVATDMLKGTIKIFSKGNLIDAILSSSAYPGVFTPMKLGSNIYSDGGLTNNFPIDLINYKSDFSVGIDLSTFSSVKEDNLKDMFDIMNRSLDIIRNQNINNKHMLADINLTPTKGKNLGTFDTNPKILEEIFELGYSYTEDYFKQNPNKLSLLKNSI